MSGGSYNYAYITVEAEYVGKMFDAELDSLMKDLVVVLHDLEWWVDDDISEEDYRDAVRKFKKKWFGNRDERLVQIIQDECEKLKVELLKVVEA